MCKNKQAHKIHGVFHMAIKDEKKLHMTSLKVLLCMFFMVTGFLVFAGDGNFSKKTFIADNDSTSKALKKASNREARKATLFSAVIPGAGQVYNRKYWKVPFIYAAFASLGYLGINNHNSYKKYQNALSIRFDGDAATLDDYDPKYTSENLVALKKQYKKRRDFCFIGVAGVYLLNIIDANVDGHLKGFDKNMDEKISFNVSPHSDVIYTLNKPVYYSGLQFKIRF
ncbi:MAG: DUF5683 domain-containing protein [Bacteroidia bacterium]